MVFAKRLRVVGGEFRKKYLQSTDEADRTQYEEDWTQMEVKPVTNISFVYSWLRAAARVGRYT